MESDWVKYRGIVDVDGNVNAWGLHWRLASGIVVFKVESEFTNLYMQHMVPWQHYIPILRDLSDLEIATKLVTLKPSASHGRRRKKGFFRGNGVVNYERILQEPMLLESITKNAFDFTQRFTYKKVVERVVNQLNDILLRRNVGL
jgi:glutathionyl-hydroquinone reductase